MLSIISITVIVTAAATYYSLRPNAARLDKFYQWIRNPAAYPSWTLAAGTRCGSAPFIWPTDGFAGFLWGDRMSMRHIHQGVDIFGGKGVGVTPVIAAYPGYLFRQTQWKSAVIVRVPDDPLHPGQQIWLYYTHMADQFGNSFISSEFPPGISEKFVEAGTLLGYQGNYSGDPNKPVGVHLHFSIVKDDGTGHFMNELDIHNTLDPSPYLGLPLNAYENRDQLPVCEGQDGSSQG
jgi:murein DD-endopeptidase MepM/ murein hydrolase activator NlpD